MQDNATSKPKIRKRFLFTLAIIFIVLLIVTYLPILQVEPKDYGPLVGSNPRLDLVNSTINTLFWPFIVVSLLATYFLLVRPLKGGRELTKHYDARRYTLLALSLALIIAPGTMVFDIFNNPLPGSEFLAIGVPYLFIPLAVGVIGVLLFLSASSAPNPYKKN